VVSVAIRLIFAYVLFERKRLSAHTRTRRRPLCGKPSVVFFRSVDATLTRFAPSVEHFATMPADVNYMVLWMNV